MSLNEVDSQGRDGVKIGHFFHAFRYHPSPELPSEMCSGLEDRPPTKIGMGPLDKISIDLDVIWTAVEDPTVVGVPLPDIIQSNPHPHLTQPIERSAEASCIPARSVLDDFDRQAVKRDLVGLGGLDKQSHKLPVDGGGVHVDEEMRIPGELAGRFENGRDTSPVDQIFHLVPSGVFEKNVR
jgi:hypothetical protein